MFEKETEEHCNKIQCANCGFNDGMPCQAKCHDWQDEYDVWQKGAEFGYNKANEWHYVENGDLPKDEDWKLCISYRGYCYVAKYEEMFGCWTNQEYSEVMQPYAWKEIINEWINNL